MWCHNHFVYAPVITSWSGGRERQMCYTENEINIYILGQPMLILVINYSIVSEYISFCKELEDLQK